jgi:hypothetical protein
MYGKSALLRNNTGSNNSAVGYFALNHNTTGGYNTAIGSQALISNVSGTANTALGNQSLNFNSSGGRNIAIGFQALVNNTTGFNNIAIGYQAGLNHTLGRNNIAISAFGGAGESDTTRIGEVQTRAFVAGIRGITTAYADAVTVVIDSAGQLGTVSSSRRFKEDIRNMGSTSERLLQLRPVTFRYRISYADGSQPLDFGLIAEEVAEVFPELVVYDENDQPATVKYRLLSSLLLNELQKQNASLKAQNARLESLDAQVKQLVESAGEVAKVD